MNNPVTHNTQAAASEGQSACDDLVKARHEIIAEIARVTAQYGRMRTAFLKLAQNLDIRATLCRHDALRSADQTAIDHMNARASAFENAANMVREILREV